MAIPTRSTSIKNMLEYLLYTASYLIAAGFEELGKRVLAMRDLLLEALAARNAAADKAVLLSVPMKRAWKKLPDPLDALMIQAKAWFQQRPEAYKQIFPGTRASLIRTPARRRQEVFAPIVEFARSPGLRGRTLNAARAFLVVWKEYETREREHTAAVNARTEAFARLGDVRTDCIYLMREVNGFLRQRYSANPSEVHEFFMSRPSTPRKKKEEKKDEKSGDQKKDAADAGESRTSAATKAANDAPATGAAEKKEDANIAA